MFDWFWEFLYSISKMLFRLIDGLILCANKICGIEPISFNGEETDFLSYLLFSDQVGFAFKASAILAMILLVIFTVFAILRSIAKDKAEGTPAQLAVKALKTFLMFLFVPACMMAFMALGNAFIQALYKATTQNASTTGAFLFSEFARDGGMPTEDAIKFLNGTLDYTNTDLVSTYMDISNFPFFFSWLAGGVVLFSIASAMFIFVDRVLSIVILYIVAPFSISTVMIDDGARFKLWRDQLLTKFIMGYGMIIALNIYALVCGLVMDPNFHFFQDNAFLDFIMKLLMIGGGAFTLQKSMALIGNLVSQGGGSNELRDNAASAGGLARMAGGALATVTGAKLAKSIVGDAISAKSRDLGEKMLDKMGLSTMSTEDRKKRLAHDDTNKNNNKPNYNNDGNGIKDAFNGGFKTSDWGNATRGGNQNSQRSNYNAGANNKGVLNDVINNAGKANNGGEDK